MKNILKLLSEIFGEIDFMDSKVQFFFFFLGVVIFLFVIAIFLYFKLFISKSNKQDVESIDKAIIRLKKIMLFDKIVLFIVVIIIFVLGVLHFFELIDIYQYPFNMAALVALSLIPIFLVAVFGIRGGISSNQQKLNQLKTLRK
ncbi:heme/copper-type cytochrome/quinol oxidase subunit 2 [Breznakia sp. PF5-3]|uniref:hypothetical protein n=1 Tax=unclassified Breznakia TaxID=2623764 RepID=UPI002405DC5F|nr:MULTISPECIES: hypothetical protein [unclassified Breznakia]MDF9823959.1 heme/copper-type cytochrome/quinol oxidase subunit 2 [Breznakia sp. PM6-1]MDF9834758.1 heme/copper-type cytochrome/quinol oxidase subunit 2 [Breznakia sp. PF5-3]MDF9838366.1 heme/copper-type cytochrome/quinol oxidase subunit 2 [Breznakia sp. PFB2-8]MDF9860382.1 heme/copper-type cytochrome/quinol oxidase subunit 2 [Breznakia sp. PH5-24]